MSENKSFTIKLLFATFVACIICTSLTMFSYAVHNNTVSIDGNHAPLALLNGDTARDEETLSSDAPPISASEMSDNKNRNEAPEGVPAAIGQEDGSVYVFQEEVVDDNGNSSYVYSNNDSPNFDDGGLGDAELIISE